VTQNAVTHHLVTDDPAIHEPDRVSPVPQQSETRSAAETRQLGRELGRRLGAGDLVILSGELGAGKTTFTQGLADGLGVRGPITSPTFVIARVHPSLVGGVPLVHVDAYRLGSLDELDDLDLDTDVEQSVTVVEWGEGKAEVLSGRRITVHLDRARADDAAGDDARLITVTGYGYEGQAAPPVQGSTTTVVPTEVKSQTA
jgi:tRNA threonylcarbamoyladenosine biosynthesis protein TsaE